MAGRVRGLMSTPFFGAIATSSGRLYRDFKSSEMRAAQNRVRGPVTPSGYAHRLQERHPEPARPIPADPRWWWNDSPPRWRSFNPSHSTLTPGTTPRCGESLHFRPASYSGPSTIASECSKIPTATAGRSIHHFLRGNDHAMDLAVHFDGSVFVATRNEILRLRRLQRRRQGG